MSGAEAGPREFPQAPGLGAHTQGPAGGWDRPMAELEHRQAEEGVGVTPAPIRAVHEYFTEAGSSLTVRPSSRMS